MDSIKGFRYQVKNSAYPESRNTKNNRKSYSRRTLLAILGAACLFFILGVGNLLIGLYKSHDYGTLLEKAKYQIESTDTPMIPLVGDGLNIDTQTQHIKKLQYRLDYYNLVTLGGKVFLAASGILVLLCLFVKTSVEEKH